MFARITKAVKWQRPLIWTLLIAFLLHLLLLFITGSSQEPSIEQLYSQATQVVLYDLEPDPEPEVPEPEVAEEQPKEQLEESAPQEVTSVEELKPAQSEETSDKQEETTPLDETDNRPQLSKSLVSRSLEIARLEAQLKEMQNSYAQQPRVRRISSGAPMSSEEALYLRQWEQKVERVGNLNYPEEARRQNLGGRLRLLVVIAADGRILEAQLLTSSGHKLLDEAAVRILNLAAPFAPLPEPIRAKADVLEIIRTWQFGDGWYAN